MTYTISGEFNGLDYSQLRALLSDANKFIEKPVSEKVHISFGTFNTTTQISKAANYDPAFIKQYAAIKNVLTNHNVICDKTILFKTIEKLIPMGIKFLPKTYTHIDKFDNPLILKKKDMAAQTGVRVITSKADFERAKKELHLYDGNYIISEYITNPLTIDGKKFHLRVYFLLSSISGIIRCCSHNEYRILTAELPYIASDWPNKKIHLSGGHHTKKRYIWPNDFDSIINTTLKTNLEECKNVLCLAMASSNIKNYPESDAGYHLYAADLLLTNDNNIYILEVNKRPGFGCYGEPDGWGEFNKTFSHNLFSFILDNTIFPYFGIKRFPHKSAMVIGNGTLTPFANNLIHYGLIPLGDATQEEIASAMKYNFYNDKLSFQYVMDYCHNVCLIGGDGHLIIGYIGLYSFEFPDGSKLDLALKIAISEEYQNRGIGTAIIAAYMEMYAAIHYPHNPTIHILNSKRFNFLTNIANRMSFIMEGKKYYSRKCRITNTIIKKINEHKLLTYNLITIYDGTNQDFLIKELEHLMVQTHSQFVHLSFSAVSKQHIITKASTGSKYNKVFMMQGAELKSALNFETKKIINSVYIFENWATKPNQLFEPIISLQNCQDGQFYVFYDVTDTTVSYKTKQYFSKNVKNDLQKYNILEENCIIKKYNPPYLLDGRKMNLRIYFFIYAGANGIKKCFALNTSHIITAKNKYSIEKESDWNNQDIDYPKYGTTDKIYDLKSVFSDLKSHDLNSGNTIDNIHSFIQQVADLVVESDFIPFPESNAGFTNFVILAKFIQSANNTYTPIIDQIFNNTQIHNLQISNKENEKLINDFSKEFYSIIKDGIICPHFGINTHSLQRPNAIHSNNKLIDAKLISELYLEFNSNRDNINIYINGHQCGHIKLDLKLENLIVNLSHIEIDASHRRKKIALHSIFILMDILAAYYAPDIISLQFNSDFIAIHSIAYKLNFQTTSLEKKSHIFIRLCRSIDS